MRTALTSAACSISRTTSANSRNVWPSPIQEIGYPRAAGALGEKLKRVVDVNVLRTAGLEDYLAADSANMIVFTEEVCIESYSGDPLKNLHSSLAIVRRYPSQVLILKGTRDVIREQAETEGGKSVELLVDRSQTDGFAEFCVVVDLALSDPEAARGVVELGRKASERLERLRADADGFVEAVKEVSRSLPSPILSALRSGTPFSEETIDLIIPNVLYLTALLFRDHPDVPRAPSAGVELRNSFIFRNAISTYVLVLWWMSHGGIETASRSRLRNDLMDMKHVAYATFFDGILSVDRKLLQLYDDASFLLTHAFPI